MCTENDFYFIFRFKDFYFQRSLIKTFSFWNLAKFFISYFFLILILFLVSFRILYTPSLFFHLICITDVFLLPLLHSEIPLHFLFLWLFLLINSFRFWKFSLIFVLLYSIQCDMRNFLCFLNKKLSLWNFFILMCFHFFHYNNKKNKISCILFGNR